MQDRMNSPETNDDRLFHRAAFLAWENDLLEEAKLFCSRALELTDNSNYRLLLLNTVKSLFTIESHSGESVIQRMLWNY